MPNLKGASVRGGLRGVQAVQGSQGGGGGEDRHMGGGRKGGLHLCQPVLMRLLA